MLPEQFLQRMERMLGDEYPAFLAACEKDRALALRLNPQKTSPEDFLKKAPFHLRPIPWEPDGFFYDSADSPGRHPYHEAGVYYIQEPSAMAPAVYLNAGPGERILDLCAAPGGKSTKLAADMKGEGLLVSNEIHPARARILSGNIERMGIRNCIVTNESPRTLAGMWENSFDRILVDAPCSGEGMFRKNEDACGEWSPEAVAGCALRQLEILSCAASMLRPGGRLVYSTCTFAPEENEGTVSRFLSAHPDFAILPVTKYEGMTSGVPAWTERPADGIENTVRLFPHKICGEGHFLAVLQKRVRGRDFPERFCTLQTQKTLPQGGGGEYAAFAEEYLRVRLPGHFIRFGDQLYLAPQDMPDIRGLKVLRPGLHLGAFKKNRFEPSHALALTLRPEDVRSSHRLDADGPDIRAYLGGQTLQCSGEKGWCLITADGYSIGWGKCAGRTMKNHYPKGLRINYA